MSLLDKSKIAKSFSRSAKSYDQVAVLQQTVGERLVNHLELIKLKPEKILDLGSGTGAVTQLLEKKFSEAKIVSADIAYGMLKHARSKKSWLGQQEFVCADAEHLPFPDNHFDFIFSNFVLHWCHDFKQAFREISRVLKPEGLFLFSTLGPDTLSELRMSWAQVDDKPHVHLFIDMHDIGDCLIHAGLADPVLDVEYFTLLYPDIFQLMRELKQLGVTNLLIDRHRGLTGKKSLQKLVSAYEIYRTAESKLPETWEVVYGHAWGKDLTALQEQNELGEVRIPISSIKRT